MKITKFGAIGDEMPSNFTMPKPGVIEYTGGKSVRVSLRMASGDSKAWVVKLEPGDVITLPPCDIHSVDIDTI